MVCFYTEISCLASFSTSLGLVTSKCDEEGQCNNRSSSYLPGQDLRGLFEHKRKKHLNVPFISVFVRDCQTLPILIKAPLQRRLWCCIFMIP